MKLTTTVFDLVVFFPDSIDILDGYNLDYYCNGSKPFIKACEEKGIRPEIIWQEIQKTEYVSRSVNRAVLEWNAKFLTDVILRHYSDFKTKLPDIRQALDNMLDNCSSTDRNNLFPILICFNQLGDAVSKHSTEEEEALLHALDIYQNDEAQGAPLAVLENEHMRIGTLISKLRELTMNYNANSLKFPFATLPFIMLQQFDKELTKRLHLENNILFPKLKKSAL